MPSLVTSIIGGFQGASAAHNAAGALQKGYGQAGTTVTNAVNQVNPGIIDTAATAGQGVTTAAGAAGTGATTAAGTGAAGATSAADTLTGYLSPYMTAGSTAAAGLTAASQPFTASMMSQYSPAYQLQLQQGQQAAARQASAMGVTGSGGTAKALQQYAQNYSGTAFSNAANIYNQNFQRLATVAGMGQSAATTAGQAGLQAAEYGGTLGENAAQYAGTAGMTGAEYAGNADINAENLTAQNTLSGAGYLANTQIGAQQALAQGDLGAASAWNGMLGGIGSAANTLALGGLGTNASGGLSWSPSNLATNLWGGGSGGGGGNPYANSPGSNTWTPYGPIAPPQTRIPAGG